MISNTHISNMQNMCLGRSVIDKLLTCLEFSLAAARPRRRNCKFFRHFKVIQAARLQLRLLDELPFTAAARVVRGRRAQDETAPPLERWIERMETLTQRGAASHDPHNAPAA